MSLASACFCLSKFHLNPNANYRSIDLRTWQIPKLPADCFLQSGKKQISLLLFVASLTFSWRFSNFYPFSSRFLATFTEGGGGGGNTLIVTDSKNNLKESTGLPTATTTASTLGPPSLSVGNHLDIPQNQNNPNLLSPDVLGARRGAFFIVTFIAQ
jgi:hypothetical protein